MQNRKGALALGLALTVSLTGCATTSQQGQARTSGLSCSQAETEAEGLGEVVEAQLTYERQGKARVRRPSGVEVRLMARAGVSAPYLQRLAHCHMAAAEPGSPLAMEGLSLQVSQDGPYFALSIETPGPDEARALLEHVQRSARL